MRVLRFLRCSLRSIRITQRLPLRRSDRTREHLTGRGMRLMLQPLQRSLGIVRIDELLLLIGSDRIRDDGCSHRRRPFVGERDVRARKNRDKQQDRNNYTASAQ